MKPFTRAAFVALAWVAIGAVLAVSGVVLELTLNFFDWHPRWSFEALLAVATYLAGVFASVALHRATRGPLPMLTAAAVTLALTGLGIARLQPDTLSPHTMFGRDVASPAAYRILFAAAAALPALLLVVRRWALDDSDAWFRRKKGWFAPLAALASGCLVAGWVGHHVNDPARYAEAGKVLEGPDPLAGMFDALFSVVTLGALRLPDRTDECRRALEKFRSSPAVPASIKAEVSAACTGEAAEPIRAHRCAREALERGRARLESQRSRYAGLALAAFPIGGIALIFAWRARQRRATEFTPGAGS